MPVMPGFRARWSSSCLVYLDGLIDVYIYIYVYLYMYMRWSSSWCCLVYLNGDRLMNGWMDGWMDGWMHACMHACVCMYACMHVCMCMCVYIYVHILCISVDIYAHTHTCIHTYIHIHVNIQVDLVSVLPDSEWALDGFERSSDHSDRAPQVCARAPADLCVHGVSMCTRESGRI